MGHLSAAHSRSIGPWAAPLPEGPLPPLARPFVAERYAEWRRLPVLIAPPYDVISPARRAELAASPHNVVHLTLPEDRVDRYAHAASLLADWRDHGVLRRDPEPTVTALRQEFTAPDGRRRVRSGLIAAVRAEPYETGRVRPHERTHEGPKEDRFRLLEATRTALEPILLVARDESGALAGALQDATTRAPDAVVELEGVGHRLWIVSGAQADSLAATARAPLYVADGHHRYETAATYAASRPPADWIPALIVPLTDPGLAILPTHRVIMGAVEHSSFYSAVAQEAEPARDAAACTVVWPAGREVRLARSARFSRAVPGASDEPAVAWAERHVVRRLLEAGGAGARLHYTHDAMEARLLVRQGSAGAAVLLAPTPISDVLATADAGGTLPPKSTYFYPKVPSGLVLGPLA